jgi:hypothetical protein
MKYTRKRNRRRIVRGGQNSPKVENLGCCEKALFGAMDKIFPHEPPRPSGATPRSRRPVNSPASYGRAVSVQPGKKSSGTKRRGKKRKKRNN